MKQKLVTHFILYLPFYVLAIFISMGWSFEWEIAGGIVGSSIVTLFASICFYVGLKRKFIQRKKVFLNFSLYIFIYYLVGPIGADFDIAAFHRSGQALYFVETNNLAGATSGVTAHVIVFEGKILLRNGRYLGPVYNYNTAQFFQQNGVVTLKMGRTYMASDEYPDFACFELSPVELKELSCESVK